MICGHDIHFVGQWVPFCAIIPCVAFFGALFASPSHPTCSAHPSEGKGASSVCHDIKGRGFKEYTDDAYFCLCACVHSFFLLEIKIG